MLLEIAKMAIIWLSIRMDEFIINKVFKLILSIIFGILFFHAYNMNTYVNISIEMLYQRSLIFLFVFSSVGCIEEYLDIKVSYIFGYIISFYIFFMHTEIFRNKFISELKNSLNRFYHSSSSKKRKQAINNILRKLFILLINNDIDNTMIERLKSLFYKQSLQDPSIFGPLLASTVNFDRRFLKKYFELNFKAYNYIYVSYMSVPFEHYLLHVNYVYWIFGNKYLGYLKLKDFIAKRKGYNPMINIMFMFY